MPVSFRSDLEEAALPSRSSTSTSQADMPDALQRAAAAHRAAAAKQAEVLAAREGRGDKGLAAAKHAETVASLRWMKRIAVVALLLGAAGTALGLVGMLQDDNAVSAAAVVQDKNDGSGGNGSGNGDGTSGNGNGNTDASFLLSPTMDLIRERGILLCGLPFTSTPGTYASCCWPSGTALFV